MKLLTVDFETYYDKEYSLSKMTTEEYIRDSRFEAIGVSVQEGELSSGWFSGTHAQIKKFLAQYDWQNAAALAHNAMFDMAILNWHFGIKPKKVADTLSMARALHTIEVGGSLAALAEYYGLGAKGTEVGDALGKRRLDFTAEELARYGEYCKNDVALTYKLFGRLAQGFPVSELNLIDLTIRMFSEPVIELDVGVLELNLKNVREAKRVALAKAMIDKDQLMSNDQLAELLRSLGVQPPTKISPTTGKQAYAFAKTDEAFLELLEHDNLHVQALAAARLGVKSTIEESRTERLLSIATRGLMPIPLRYYAAHTGRWGGDDKVNMQNLPRNSVLKYALRAPTGYKFIDCDSSQIEARTLAWWAGQDDLVTAFERGDDVYKIMASAIYGKPVEEIDKSERFVGKATILGSGYNMGPNRFQVQLQNFKVVTPLEECQRIIAVYRQTYDRIPELWKQAGEALVAMMNDQTAPLGRDGVVVVEGRKGIRLPNGLYLRYPNLRWHNDATTGKKEMVYDTKKGKSVIPNRIYGGKVVENCIAEGTPVLTHRGWIPIEAVLTTDLVHDGVEFVSHGGRIFKSVQTCVTVDGVYMTPDHEVLTDEGWKRASQLPRPYRPQIRDAYGSEAKPHKRAKMVLGLCVRMWNYVCQMWGGCNEGATARGDAQLRVRDGQTYIGAEQNPRYEQASSVRGMAQHVRQMPSPYSSGMGQLRRAGYICVRTLAEGVRVLLGGYGACLSARAGFGPNRQQQGVLSSELSMGFSAGEHDEQAKHRATSRRTGTKSSNGDSPYHHLLQAGARLAFGAVNTQAKPEKPVYDIVDAGPRHRFVVRGDSGPFVVHNCCQAIARIVIGEQLIRVSRKYRVALTVHDAIGVVVPEAQETEGLEFVEQCMRTRPVWAPDLPLNCEGGSGESYGDC